MASDRSSTSLIAALALAALAPAACVLWFMNVAMRNERLAVQERMAEVYVSQLGSLQRQVEAFWTERQAMVAAVTGDSAMEKFAGVVRANLADAAVIHDDNGKPVYPNTPPLDAPREDRTEWTAAREQEFQKKDYPAAAAAYARIVGASRDIHTKARALQAEATCWLKAGRKREALERLSQIAGDSTLRNAISAQGTLIAPSAQLLLLKLLNVGTTSVGSAQVEQDSRDGMPASGSPAGFLAQRTLDDLVGRLNDYSARNFPAAQRRFLMHELKSLIARVEFPTLAAEDLAADYLSADSLPPTDGKLQRTPLAGVWRLLSGERGVIALYREERLKAEMTRLLDAAAPADVSVRLLAPGEPFVASKLVPLHDAGELFPGWRLGLSFRHGDPLMEASARQTRFYFWTGFAVVAIIALLALIVARTVSAQMRLARMKNELVSTVSHELRTPLASMRALVETLSARRYRDDGQLHDYLNLIAKENQRLSHLIENFLSFSRLERGRERFCFEPIAADVLVANAVAALREKLKSEECHFESQVAPGLPAVHGDADALTTVLVNLLDNACKYTEADKRIVARAYANCDAVCFEVMDNGVGLHPGDTKKIFERFYQVDHSLTRQRGGCGLGLSIVQSIVRAHGGVIEVESELGKGSTFRVRLPMPGVRSRGKAATAAESR